MGISSHLSSDGSELTIVISGRFDFGLYRDFRVAYSEGTTRTSYKIDLSGVDYMDSAALGMLLLMRDYAGGDKARIRLVGIRENLMRIFKISQFSGLFDLKLAA